MFDDLVLYAWRVNLCTNLAAIRVGNILFDASASVALVDAATSCSMARDGVWGVGRDWLPQAPTLLPACVAALDLAAPRAARSAVRPHR